MNFCHDGAMHKPLFTNRDIVERTGMTLDQVRRNVKDILPSDPEADCRSGKTRYHTANDAYFIVLGNFIVNNLGLSVQDAKNIFKDIKPWLEKENLLPECGEIKPEYPIFEERIAVDLGEESKEIYLGQYTTPTYFPYIIEIRRIMNTTQFFYRTIKVLETTPSEWHKLQVIKTYTIEGNILPAPDNLVCDELTVYRLPISDLLRDFRYKFNVAPAR